MRVPYSKNLSFCLSARNELCHHFLVINAITKKKFNLVTSYTDGGLKKEDIYTFLGQKARGQGQSDICCNVIAQKVYFLEISNIIQRWRKERGRHVWIFGSKVKGHGHINTLYLHFV